MQSKATRDTKARQYSDHLTAAFEGKPRVFHVPFEKVAADPHIDVFLFDEQDATLLVTAGMSARAQRTPARGRFPRRVELFMRVPKGLDDGQLRSGCHFLWRAAQWPHLASKFLDEDHLLGALGPICDGSKIDALAFSALDAAAEPRLADYGARVRADILGPMASRRTSAASFPRGPSAPARDTAYEDATATTRR